MNQSKSKILDKNLDLGPRIHKSMGTINTRDQVAG